MVKIVVFIGSLLLSSPSLQAMPGLLDIYFGHLGGANSEQGMDFFTREPNLSELSQVFSLLKGLRAGQKSLAEVDDGLVPLGAALDESSAIEIAKWDALQKVANLWAPPEDRDEKWVLTIKNLRLFGDLISGLQNSISVAAFMRASQIHRLHIVLNEERRREVHVLRGVGRSIFSTQPMEEGIYFRYSTDRYLGWNLPEGKTFSQFVPDTDLTVLSGKLKTIFLGESELGAFELRFATLGFGEIAPLFKAYEFSTARDLLIPILGAMGYQFAPRAPNQGYFILDNSDRPADAVAQRLLRERPRTLRPSVGHEKVDTDVSSTLIEEYVRFHQMGAAAILVLIRHQEILPSEAVRDTSSEFRQLSAEYGNRGWIARSPIKSLIALARRKYREEFDEILVQGPKKNWDWSEDQTESGCELLARRRPRPRRR